MAKYNPNEMVAKEYTSYELLGDNTYARKVLPTTGGSIVDDKNPLPVRRIENDMDTFQILPFVNPTFGVDMNADFQFTGTPEPIHNGTDTIEWTATAVSGTWDFASTDQAHTGTKSIDGSLAGDQDTMDIADGGDVTGYIAVTGWVYLTAWNAAKNNGLQFYAWDGALVGNEVEMESYFDQNLLNTWQKFIIPLEDMGVTTELIDSFRVRVESDTPATLGPNFYFDDIQLEEQGGAVFKATPLPGTWFHVKSLRTIISITYDPALLNFSGIAIDPLSFFGLPQLLNGIVQFYKTNGNIMPSVTLDSINSYLDIPDTIITNVVSDGTTTTFTVDTKTTAVSTTLKSELDDFGGIELADDFSSFLRFRTFVSGITEYRP